MLHRIVTFVKLLTYKNLTDGELRIIDKYEVNKDPNMPRNISYVDLITTTGAEFLWWYEQ